ncbi:MAG: DUF3288 family protein [Microcystaceae cyanobacterium]
MAVTDQKHPQEKRDREIIDRLLRANPEALNLADLARLRIRYKNFPGARAIQHDLDSILQQWQLNEEQLFEQTRQLYATGQAYKPRNTEEEDWS